MLVARSRRLSAIKHTLTLFLLLLSFNALSAEPDYSEEDHILVGIDMVYDSGLHQAQDGFFYPDLNFDIRQGKMFAKGNTFGYDLFEGSRASFSLAITRGEHFLDLDTINDPNNPLYYGLEDKKRAIEAGFIYKYRSRVGLVSFEYYKDYSDAHDGLRTVFRITRPIPNNEGLVMTPSLFVNYYSRKFNRYYYGVTEEQNRKATLQAYGLVNDTTLSRYENITRREYQPKNSAQLGVDINLRMPLTEEFSVTGYLSYEDIVGEAFRSPLVEDRKHYRAKIGLAYTF
jgi:outer membrane scaffolding protein for murein synthesis (MipA/OmpV family)